jgi:transketolase
VVDMPSIDEDLLLRLHDSGKLIIFAEQNNGYIWLNYLRVLARRGAGSGMDRVMTVNALSPQGRPQFIHSATYEELIEVYHLSGAGLRAKVEQRLQEERR